MNSEAADLQPQQYQRYLSIGRTGNTILEDDAVVQDIFGNMQVLRSKSEEAENDTEAGRGQMDMPFTSDPGSSTPTKKKEVTLTWGSPGSLYDTTGFLREG